MSLNKGDKEITLLTKVPPKTAPKTITTNGTYKASDENLDGYSEVEVQTSGVDINDYMGQNIDYAHNTVLKLIKKLPELNISVITNMDNFFSYMSYLTELKNIDMSNITSAYRICCGCSSLTIVELKDTKKVKSMKEGFYGCTSLETISAFDGSSLNDVNRMFQNCTAIKNVGGIIDIGKAYETTATEAYTNYTLSFGNALKLTRESLMNIINNLYDIKTKGCKPQKLILTPTNLSKLTEEEVAIATNKGWIVS